MGGRPPLESPADLGRTSPWPISFAVMDVTVAGLSPVRRAISALPMGPCLLMAFKTCERLIARMRVRLPVGAVIEILYSVNKDINIVTFSEDVSREE
jgi:hypothetical protein